MRTKVFAAVLLAVMLFAFFATRDTPVREALLAKPSPAEIALDRVLPDVNLDGLPLDEAVARLESISGVAFVVNWQELESRGYGRKSPVRVWARNVRLADAVRLLLEDVRAGRDPELRYAPDDGAVVIGTADAVSGLVTRCYSVRDLVPPDPHDAPAAVPALPADTNGTGGGGGLFGNQQERVAPVDEPGRGEELISLIQVALNPSRHAAGDAQYFTGGRILIVGTWEYHRGVQTVLESLRHPVAPAAARSAGWLIWDGPLQHWVAAGPEAAERALRKVLPEVRIENATLQAAVDTLARLADAKLVLREEQIKLVSPRAAEVTLRLNHVTLGQALEAVLEESNASRLTYTVIDDAIVVTSTSDENLPTVTRVYDLRDWPQVGAAVERHRGRAAGEKLAGEKLKTRAGDLDELVEAIMTTVAPDSWRDNGGTAHMLFVADRVVVTQTWRNHEQVRWFLNALRAGPPPAASAPGTRPAGKPSNLPGRSSLGAQP